MFFIYSARGYIYIYINIYIYIYIPIREGKYKPYADEDDGAKLIELLVWFKARIQARDVIYIYIYKYTYTYTYIYIYIYIWIQICVTC